MSLLVFIFVTKAEINYSVTWFVSTCWHITHASVRYSPNMSYLSQWCLRSYNKQSGTWFEARPTAGFHSIKKKHSITKTDQLTQRSLQCKDVISEIPTWSRFDEYRYTMISCNSSTHKAQKSIMVLDTEYQPWAATVNLKCVAVLVTFNNFNLAYLEFGLHIFLQKLCCVVC